MHKQYQILLRNMDVTEEPLMVHRPGTTSARYRKQQAEKNTTRFMQLSTNYWELSFSAGKGSGERKEESTYHRTPVLTVTPVYMQGEELVHLLIGVDVLDSDGDVSLIGALTMKAVAAIESGQTTERIDGRETARTESTQRSPSPGR